MTNRQLFESYFKKYIRRDGADKLLEYLGTSDFFEAPASTQYHLSCAGGLCTHSLNVYGRLLDMYVSEKAGKELTPEEEEKIAICALLHDLCKVNFYKPGTRNVKDENGKWQSVPTYTIEDSLPYGHGEKSVYIISGFMKLTREEAMAIRWHMMGFDDAVRGGSRALSAAAEQYPLIVQIHAADLMASYIDEVRD